MDTKPNKPQPLHLSNGDKSNEEKKREGMEMRIVEVLCVRRYDNRFDTNLGSSVVDQSHY